jgi:hypothetical protein
MLYDITRCCDGYTNDMLGRLLAQMVAAGGVSCMHCSSV